MVCHGHGNEVLITDSDECIENANFKVDANFADSK